VLLLFDFAAFVRVALFRVLAVLDDFAVLPRFLLDFFHLGALILEPHLRANQGNPVFISRHVNPSHHIKKCQTLSISYLQATNLHNSDTETGVLGEGLSHFSAGLGAEFKGCLECPPLLGRQYCPGPFGTPSPVMRTGRSGNQIIARELA
jgi:hypothetical protein